MNGCWFFVLWIFSVDFSPASENVKEGKTTPKFLQWRYLVWDSIWWASMQNGHKSFTKSMFCFHMPHRYLNERTHQSMRAAAVFKLSRFNTQVATTSQRKNTSHAFDTQIRMSCWNRQSACDIRRAVLWYAPRWTRRVVLTMPTQRHLSEPSTCCPCGQHFLMYSKLSSVFGRRAWWGARWLHISDDELESCGDG